MSELDRREYLSAKCLELAETAFNQRDPDSAIPLLVKSIRLTLANFAAMRLEDPVGFDFAFRRSDNAMEFIRLVCQIGGSSLVTESGLSPLIGDYQ